MEINRVAQSLVIGAGIAGIKAALELAESGAKVYLCDRKPYIGGTLIQLDRWFPDNHCGMCQTLHVFDRDKSSQFCLRQGLAHPNLEIIPLTEVQKVEGKAGDFRVTLKTKSAWVETSLCTGCGLCEQVCPVEVDNEFNRSLGKIKAISLAHPLASPRIYTINRQHCTKCGMCSERCPTGAINLSSTDTIQEVEVGAIILSTGFDEFDPSRATQYGYKRYPNVITNIELERLFINSGPTQGRLIRPSDGRIPESVAFLQCVGSRDMQRNYCSSTCCMYAIKEAMMVKEANPEARIEIFFMDLRAFGKDYYRYYRQACDMGIKFTRSRIPAIMQDFRTRDLLINTRDQGNNIATNRFDLVVLSVGQNPSPQFKETAEILGLKTNKWGFCDTLKLSPVETEREGIFVCGSASGPKDITDTLVEGIAAAGKVMTLLKLIPGTAELQLSIQEEARIAVLVCNCNGQISQEINTAGLVEFSKTLPQVVHAEEVSHLCHQGSAKDIETLMKRSGANSIILAACSTMRYFRLNESISTELINIREELAWVHQNEGKAATEKAKTLISMTLEKIKLRESSPFHTEAVIPRALVVGGGLAGMSAALAIAERGFEVDLVEQSNKIGGNARHIYSLLEGGDIQEYLHHLIEQIENNSLVHLHLETEVIRQAGYAGNFTFSLKNKNFETEDIKAGAIVIAVGAEGSQPTEYLYGQSERILTQMELEERLASGKVEPKSLKSVVMIQCVGSRDEIRPYCSRICCSQALKNALNLKEQNPELEISIFYRDLMSYGFQEEYYTLAREKGIIFIQYDPVEKPELKIVNSDLNIEAVDPVLGSSVTLKPDFLILSPAIVPHNLNLAGLLGVEITKEGFFKEAETKFRPLDFVKDGMFMCGLAHSPRNITETIVQARAAAQRATLLLSRGRLSSGRMVSQVNERRCSGCELCIKTCPYNAREKDPERGVVIVRQALCRGCGACVAVCPNKASTLQEFNDKQIFSMIDAAV